MWSWIGNAIKTATTWTKNAVNVVDRIVNPTSTTSVASTSKAVTTAKTTAGWKSKYNTVTDELGATL